jgi:hypothetical protein
MRKKMNFISFSFMTSAKRIVTELVNIVFGSNSNHFGCKTKTYLKSVQTSR